MKRTILAVSRAHLPIEILTTGFHPRKQDNIFQTLNSAGFWTGPRIELEEDERFLQIIPYVVLKRGDTIVCYRRTTEGGEKRLHGKRSIGLGGHIDLHDLAIYASRDYAKTHGDFSIEKTLLYAADRELTEEVGALNILNRRWVGFLHDADSPVGRVHLGVVGVWEIWNKVERAKEDHLTEVEHVHPWLFPGSDDSDLETWTRLLLGSLAIHLVPTPKGLGVENDKED